ncbi:hypothetical protein K456DRAFT_1720970 [Colletotrichum gloeosporioides 23]|nr:hypothetical protein K456DRAFT_1720970 [Colletotrichum gloeosporioides 23]
MSSRASAKSPTLGSSAPSKQLVKSLAEELEGALMAVDSDDEVTLKKETYEKLRNRVKKGDEDIAKIQGMNLAAANIVTTPAGGRQKLKLSPPMTYDGTPGYLKGFLIQVKNYQNFHHGDFTNQTEKVVHAATYL